MILEKLREQGIPVEVQDRSGVVEYLVQLRMPKECNRCHQKVHSRGADSSREIFDLIDDLRIEKRRIWLPRYRCGACAGPDLYAEDKEIYDLLLPPRVKLTEDARVFLIRQQLQNPVYSYSKLSKIHKISKPLIAKTLTDFLMHVRSQRIGWLILDKAVIAPFYWNNELMTCLFNIDTHTNRIGAVDVLDLDYLCGIMGKCEEWDILPKEIVCLYDPAFFDTLVYFYGQYMAFWEKDVDDLANFIKNYAGADFLEHLCEEFQSVSNDSLIDNYYRYTPPYGEHRSLDDQLTCKEIEYLLMRNNAVSLLNDHIEYINRTIEEIKILRSRGIAYHAIALQVIFKNEFTKEALRGTDLAKYLI